MVTPCHSSSLDPLWRASTLWLADGLSVKDGGELPMNHFLVQVQSKGHTTIRDGSYSNEHWESNDDKMENENNKDHGLARSGDRLLVYCSSEVSNKDLPSKDYRMSLAFSVDVRSVSKDRTTFELGDLKWFSNPLKRKTIKYKIDKGEMDRIFLKCGTQGFNITKLESVAVEQILAIVEPKIPPSFPSYDRHQTALRRVRRAVQAAVRHLRGRFQRRDRG